MTIRTATLHDIPQIQVVRNAVTENTLSDPGLVTDQDCAEFITERGKGWVCEIDHQIVGFAIVDLRENNITAFNTRAEQFYRKAGWTEVGTHGTKEIKFEMTYEDWTKAT